MKTAEIKKVEAALAVVRDSEKLLIDLRFSKSSHSFSRDLGNSGIDHYLKATKRTLRARLFIIAISALWRWICRWLQAGN